MERRIAAIEYEQMILSRYTNARNRNGKSLDRSIYLLMSRIDGQGPLSIGELSAIFHLDVSTLQRQTTVAMREGLLVRIPDPAGNIARKFTLTDHGRERLNESREQALSAIDSITAAWSTADVNNFAELLHRFNTSIEEYRESRLPKS